MERDMTLVVDRHSMQLDTAVQDTSQWLAPRVARAVLVPPPTSAALGSLSVLPGWVIENHDGSLVLAALGDVLEFDGERVTRCS
jgi:hypothetical protein